jgi:hypothetical protein
MSLRHNDRVVKKLSEGIRRSAGRLLGFSELEPDDRKTYS